MCDEWGSGVSFCYTIGDSISLGLHHQESHFVLYMGLSSCYMVDIRSRRLWKRIDPASTQPVSRDQQREWLKCRSQRQHLGRNLEHHLSDTVLHPRRYQSPVSQRVRTRMTSRNRLSFTPLRPAPSLKTASTTMTRASRISPRMFDELSASRTIPHCQH